MIIFKGSDFYDEFDQIIEAIAWSVCTTVPSNLPYSPAQLIFGKDMIFCQKVVIDLEMIKVIRAKETVKNSKKKKSRHLIIIKLET